MKSKTLSKIGNYLFWIALLVIIVVPSFRAEVFGFLQRGLLEIGVMNPDVESVATSAKKTTAYPQADYALVLQNEKGQNVELSSLKGKVIFINFWATWCPPCVAEMPSINQLYQGFKNDDRVAFVLLSMDEDFEKAIAFHQRKEFDFSIYRPVSTIPPVFDASGLPTTVVIDADGNIVFEHTGMANYNSEKFNKMLTELANQQ